jgi:hypothetical protein
MSQLQFNLVGLKVDCWGTSVFPLSGGQGFNNPRSLITPPRTRRPSDPRGVGFNPHSFRRYCAAVHANNKYFSLLVYSTYVCTDGIVIWIQSICVMVGRRLYVCFDDLSRLSLVKSARDDGWQKRWYKCRCLLACCNAVLDGKKWPSVLGDDYFCAIKL